MFYIFAFPNINPIAFTIGPIFSLGPINIYWYSLSYIFGILLGNCYANILVKKFPIGLTQRHIESFMNWIIIGIIIGGRLGYIFFYDSERYLNNPVEIVQIYKGGMSFHGGLIGLAISVFFFTRKYFIPFLAITDIIATVAPIGIFLGRIANFINGELYGRITNVKWAIIFPNSDQLPRHPSQIYEAVLEGLLLLLVMTFFTFKVHTLSKRGLNSGIFLCFYAIFRMISENYREPDFYIEFLIVNITLGQLLCVPMLIAGIFLLLKAHGSRKIY